MSDTTSSGTQLFGHAMYGSTGRLAPSSSASFSCRLMSSRF